MASNSNDRFNGVVTSLAIKAPCVVATSANITLSGEQTVNSVAVVSGDRVLVKDQTDPIENGIYCVSTSAWTRTADFDGNRDVTEFTAVSAGRSSGSPIMWYCSGVTPFTIGTSQITWEQYFDPDATGITISGTPVADQVGVWASASAVKGDANFTFNGSKLQVGSYAAMLVEVPSATNPVIVPNQADPDTGLGWVAADQMAVVAGGVELMRFVEGATDEIQLKVRLNCANQNLLNPNLVGYSIEPASFTPTGTTVSIDPTASNVAEVDLESASGNVTATLEDGPVGKYTQVTIKCQQDGATPRTVTFAVTGTLIDLDGTPHPMNTTLDGITVWTAETWNGTDWLMSGADYS